VPHCVYTGRAKSRTVRFTEKAKRDCLLTKRVKRDALLTKAIRARQHASAWPNLTDCCRTVRSNRENLGMDSESISPLLVNPGNPKLLPE
jgi:hypothetical protein